MNGLLFSLPGTPVIYYGDEIGMGDNIYLGDRNGVRTPMQWSADRNAGFSKASPQRLYLPIIIDPDYHYEAFNVEAQQNNPNSLLWWMKRIDSTPPAVQGVWTWYDRVFASGEPARAGIPPAVRGREHPGGRQSVAIPTACTTRFAGARARHGADGSVRRRRVPADYRRSVRSDLSGHGFYWFSLHPQKTRSESVEVRGRDRRIPELAVRSLETLADDDRTVSALTRLVRDLLPTRRWFRSKTRRIRTVSLADLVPLPEAEAFLSFIRVEFVDGDPEDYVLPVALAKGEAARDAEEQFRDTVLARVTAPDGEGILYGALWKPAFADALLNAIARRKRLRGRWGEVVGVHTKAFRQVWGGRGENLQSRVSRAEQSNSSIIYGERFILKLFRKVEPGINPEIDISRFLTDNGFANTPPLAGYLEYRPDHGDPVHLAILQGYIPNQGDAWNYTIDALSRYFEQALASTDPLKALRERNSTHLHDDLGSTRKSGGSDGRVSGVGAVAWRAHGTDSHGTFAIDGRPGVHA